MRRGYAKRVLKRKICDARLSRKRVKLCRVVDVCGARSAKVKVPSGVHVGNAAPTPSCCCCCCCGSTCRPAPPARDGLGPGPAPRPGLAGAGGRGRGPGGWLLSNCPCTDSSAKCPSESCFMFMFRNRRNTLAKRLWNARVLQRPAPAAPGSPPAGPPGPPALARSSFLKRLREPQLETLLQAVESRGASLTKCVLLDGLDSPEPHLLCCQIWRWPELQRGSELRRLPMCTASICCNPYHWSRLCNPESPPPPYGRFPPEKRLKPEDRAPSEDAVKEAVWGRTPPRWQGSLTTNGEGADCGLAPWCQLAYWELAERVGRLYPVQEVSVNVSTAAEPAEPAHQGLPGLCLATLARHAAPGTPPAVERTRAKIGLGVTLSREEDGVWAYNRSDNPIFVNSPTLDDPESRTLLVYRVPPGHCLNIFRADKAGSAQHWERWHRVNEEALAGPVDSHAVRISFAKGWGPKYSRQEVTACPCWLEVLLKRPPPPGPPPDPPPPSSSPPPPPCSPCR